MWKQVLGYENAYMINEYGDLRNCKGELINKQNRADGYLQYQLCKKGIRRSVKVHRLVAIHFVENPNSYNIVNHIDGDKLNNYYKNLEWCTYKENNQHAWDTGLKTASNIQRMSAKAIIEENRRPEKLMKKVTCLENGITYQSLTEASKELNVDVSKISAVCRGNRRHTGGYSFMYVEVGAKK